ncbi:AAA domain-containing protein [Saccharopolyspora erythraea NRRL 2338]|uniref:DNA repair protein RadA domain protein n=2 Tax=Saccharopolyspora erythraea TaxID=1836 RepID=A4F8S8_SACEN|nr:AAA family ATPase [Saccharopolyspora erythraea]EQD86748.1 DNA repair protein RadA [Saccharopolyspora erythraea D]PFG94248.1 AAA domain-containing protein [Saccharopolyspora erythraea NRRL 2338]QRK91020.1 AAA family ATPase [Saccharopolyspora erythraea]CAM00453.1 DNA repair protein RadA domain protein [Saccharopolyspora erythraea NRRL 2338]
MSTTEPDNVRPLRRHPAEALADAWTADALMATDFPDPRWAVPGILAEGVNVLAGPPKVGKSWMSLGLALAVASGGRAFDMVDVEPGPVLYLALEDTPRRLKTRMGKLLGDEPAPRNLSLATSCPTLPAGGDEAIAAWLDQNPDARMVVLDVFAKMRGTPPAGMSAYDADYAAIGRAKQLADRYGVAFVLVHHVRKMGSEDFLETVSGSNGIAGAADATLVLRRGRNKADGVLQVTGRDIDEAEYALAFHPNSGAWQLLEGPATDHTLHDTRATILRHVRESPGDGPTAIARATGIELSSVKQACRRMAGDGQLNATSSGKYFPIDGDTDPTTEVSPLSPCHQTSLDLHE